MSKSSVLCALCVVVALMICVSSADAAQPSAAKLSQMGLSGATVVSDSVAMEVRGFGYRGRSRSSSTIWGKSKVEAEIDLGIVELELKAENGYHSTQGGSQKGENFSFVGIGIGSVENENAHNEVELGAIVAFAGGSSSVKVGGRRGGH
jgi:hypothetical protein